MLLAGWEARIVKNCDRAPAGTKHRSQVIVLPILKLLKPLTNANLKLTLGLNRLLRLN